MACQKCVYLKELALIHLKESFEWSSLLTLRALWAVRKAVDTTCTNKAVRATESAVVIKFLRNNIQDKYYDEIRVIKVVSMLSNVL